MQVLTEGLHPHQATLRVWSDGLPMDQSVERHLFEPFFSSESRSSGLGLYICRQLCEGHGASIAYQRSLREVAGQMAEGNEFFVHFVRVAPATAATGTAAATATTDEAISTPWPIPTL